MNAENVPAPGAALVDAIVFDGDGLVPAVVQQHNTGEVLMLAWMNLEAVEATLAAGEAHYYSRLTPDPMAQGRGLRAKPNAWSKCALTAMATPCCCWWTRPGLPATRVAAVAGSTPSATTPSK